MDFQAAFFVQNTAISVKGVGKHVVVLLYY